MNPEILQHRTRNFSIRVIRLIHRFPYSQTGNVIGKQLLRCATSVGANYRAACRAKSPADFICKINMVEEEADESIYWLDLIQTLGLVEASETASLLKEAQELTAIFTASGRTAKQNHRL